MRFRDMVHVRRANHERGDFFFAPDSLAFFNSLVDDRLYHGRLFLTSESPGDDVERKITVRYAEADGRIVEASEFMEFSDVESAIKHIERCRARFDDGFPNRWPTR